mgnify:CR=1 FL=1
MSATLTGTAKPTWPFSVTPIPGWEQAVEQAGGVGCDIGLAGFEADPGLAEQFGVAFADVVPQAVNPQIVRLLPERLARQRSCVEVPVVAMATRVIASRKRGLTP